MRSLFSLSGFQCLFTSDFHLLCRFFAALITFVFVGISSGFHFPCREPPHLSGWQDHVNTCMHIHTYTRAHTAVSQNSLAPRWAESQHFMEPSAGICTGPPGGGLGVGLSLMKRVGTSSVPAEMHQFSALLSIMCRT